MAYNIAETFVLFYGSFNLLVTKLVLIIIIPTANIYGAMI